MSGRGGWAVKEAFQQFGWSVAVAVRGGGGGGVGGVEYVAVGAPYEGNSSVGSASAGFAVMGGGVGVGVSYDNGGVWVYGGRPLVLLAHVKAPVAANQQFGQSVSFGGGGVLAIGSADSCTVYIVDVW